MYGNNEGTTQENNLLVYHMYTSPRTLSNKLTIHRVQKYWLQVQLQPRYHSWYSVKWIFTTKRIYFKCIYTVQQPLL